MRRRFLFASALATLTVAAPAAFAQTQIDDERTTPIATSTAGDIIISSTGRVTLTAPDTAVTLDSDNDVTIDGIVNVTSDDDGGVGLHVIAGNSGDVVINGDIQVLSESEPTDDGEDEGTGFSDLDGPTAIGGSRVGVLIDGAGNYVGDVIINSTGSIVVQGNESAALSVLADMTGTLDLHGVVRVTGDESQAINIAGDVSGDLLLRGSASATGRASTAVQIDGDLGGRFYVNNGITATGYQFVNRPIGEEYIATLDEDDTYQGGPAIQIQGSIAGGILFDAPNDDNNATRSSSVTVRGEAPAVHISASTGDVTIGEVSQLAIEDNPDTEEDESQAEIALGYSFVNRGTINAYGELDDINATGVRIDGSDNGGGGYFNATLTNGFLNAGQISTRSYSNEQATNSYGVVFGNGAVIPVFTNTGTLFIENTTVGGSTNFGSAYSIVIESEAVLNSLINSGAIFGAGTGGGDGYAIVDNSGTLTDIQNTGVIAASHTTPLAYLDDEGTFVIPEDNAHTLVALDAQANTTGVNLHQFWIRDVVADDPDTEEDESLNAVLVTEADIRMTGDILLGSGDDVIRIEAGDVLGAISFGDGNDMLVLDGSDVRDEIENLLSAGRIDPLTNDELYDVLPSYVGAIDDTNGTLDIDVQWASLELTQAGELQIGDARFGDGALLEFEIDADSDSPRTLTANGTVSFEEGSRLSVSLSNLIGESGEYVILSSADLTISEGIATLADAPNPFLYETVLALDENDSNSIVLTLERKTAEELGMNANQAAAYNAAFAGWQANDALGAAIASLVTEGEFFDAYNQLLPEYASSAIQFAMAANDSSLGALATRLEAARRSPDNTGGLWLQEFGYFADRAGTAFGPGYRGHGLGMAVGFDRPFGPFYAVGINAVGAASEVEEVEGFDNPMSAITAQLGVYAAAQLGDVYIDLYGGAGMDSFEHNRQVIIGEFSSAPVAEWDGYHVTGSARIGYDIEMGRYFLRPSASIDYLSLTENEYTETGGGTGINLVIGDRDSSTFTGTALVSFGARFEGNDNWWSPTVRLGYRNEFDSTNSVTDAYFEGLDDRFTLMGQQMPGSGFIFGFGVAAGSDYSTFSLDYDADVRDDFIRHTARFVIRLVF